MANHDTRLYCLQQSSVLVKKQSSIATVAIRACLVGGLSQATASRQQSGPQAKKIDGLRILPGPSSKANSRLKPNKPLYLSANEIPTKIPDYERY